MSKLNTLVATCHSRLQFRQVYLLSFVLSIFITSESIASTGSQKAAWYRYYDSKGVANISSTVTPAHIRHGYEALDSNMQVIQKNKSYNTEADLRQSGARAEQSKRREEDIRLKKAYGSSQGALIKRDELLKKYNKQIALQQQQLKQIQKDRIMFKRQEMEYFRKGQTVPKDLKDRLNYNMVNITNIKKNIESLQRDYRNTQSQYDTIIKRLKAIE